MIMVKRVVLVSVFLLISLKPLAWGYDPLAAVNYANQYSNNNGDNGKTNPDDDTEPPFYNSDDYNYYYDNDCANFVSQCLKQGGQDLNNGIVDDKGCISSCDNLHYFLVYNLHAEYTSIEGDSSNIPSNLSPGDVVIFGDSGDFWKHAAIVVEVSGNTVKLDAHTNHRKQVTFDFFYPSADYSVANFYHFKTHAEAGVPVEFYGTGNYEGTDSLDIIIYQAGMNFLGWILSNKNIYDQDMVIGENTSEKKGCTFRIKGWCTNAHKGVPGSSDGFGQPFTSDAPAHWAYWLKKTVIYATQNGYDDYDTQSAIWYITDRSGVYNGILSAVGYPVNGPIKNQVDIVPLPQDSLDSVSIYPNPFKTENGYVTIKYNLGNYSDVRIRLFSVEGKLLQESLEYGFMGENSFFWDGTINGEKISSGIYIFVVEAFKHKIVKKIAVIK